MDYRIYCTRYLVCGCLAFALYCSPLIASANQNVRIDARYTPSESRIVTGGGQNALQQRWRLSAKAGGTGGTVGTTYVTSGPTVMPDRQLARRVVRVASRFPLHPAVTIASAMWQGAGYLYDDETGEFHEQDLGDFVDPDNVLDEGPKDLDPGRWQSSTGTTTEPGCGAGGSTYSSFVDAVNSFNRPAQLTEPYSLYQYDTSGTVHCWKFRAHHSSVGDYVYSIVTFNVGDGSTEFIHPSLDGLQYLDPAASPEDSIWDELGNVLSLQDLEDSHELMDAYFGTPDENWLDDSEYDWESLADTNVVEGWNMPLSDEEGEAIEAVADQYAEQQGVDEDPAPDPDTVDDRTADEIMLEEFGDAPPSQGPPDADWNVQEFGPGDFTEEDVDWGAGSCPEPITVTVGVGEFDISYQPLCDFADYVRFAFIAVAWLLAGWIVVVRSN